MGTAEEINNVIYITAYQMEKAGTQEMFIITGNILLNITEQKEARRVLKV